MCAHARAHTYKPFHAFPRHAGKFTPAKRHEGETRETESPITFSISGRAELSSCSRRARYHSLIINAFGSCRFFFHSGPFFLSHRRLICHSLARLTSEYRPRAFAPRALLYDGIYTRATRRVGRPSIKLQVFVTPALSKLITGYLH